MVTKEQVHAAIQALLGLAECIRELGEVPDGELYARLMGHVSLEDYTTMINKLIEAKVVKKKNHLLIWIGPVPAETSTKTTQGAE